MLLSALPPLALAFPPEPPPARPTGIDGKIAALLKSNTLTDDEACDARGTPLTAKMLAMSEPAFALYPPDLCSPADARGAVTRLDSTLVYHAATRSLVFCTAGLIENAGAVSTGSNGFGKTVTGDRKTPVGEYWLEMPFASSKFGLFIPINYPNLIDRRDGRTGSAIGIHGPARWLACQADLGLSINWTAGCLSFGRDTQIMALAYWLTLHWPVRVVIPAP